jgi:hypothetical protein
MSMISFYHRNQINHRSDKKGLARRSVHATSRLKVKLPLCCKAGDLLFTPTKAEPYAVNLRRDTGEGVSKAHFTVIARSKTEAISLLTTTDRLLRFARKDEMRLLTQLQAG